MASAKPVLMVAMTPTARQQLNHPFDNCNPFDRSNVGIRKALYVSADPDESRLQVRYWVRDDHHVLGRAHFGRGCQGPPGHAHGGSIAALLDEAMGIAAWVSGHPVVAADIRLRFRQSLPLQEVPEFHAWIEKTNGRKVFTKAVLVNEKGDRYADAEGLFVELSSERLEAMKHLFYAEDK